MNKMAAELVKGGGYKYLEDQLESYKQKGDRLEFLKKVLDKDEVLK